MMKLLSILRCLLLLPLALPLFILAFVFKPVAPVSAMLCVWALLLLGTEVKME